VSVGPGGAPAPRPRVWVLRHGATAWSEDGRHTGRTDLPLLPAGRAQAEALSRHLAGRRFELVLTSPLERARETCRLAGYGDAAELCDDLREWDYGRYEGATTAEIREHAPGWTVWTGRCPDGETIDQVARRADRVIERALGVAGDVALFAHGHILRVLTARWCELAPVEGRRFPLDTGTASILGWEHEFPAVRSWNAALS
jgi:broad specificity phosphatase PhoE